MLYRVTKLRGYTIGATDGEIGSVEDVYFVVNTGRWLMGRLVLISPPATEGRDASLKMTRDEVGPSPDYS